MVKPEIVRRKVAEASSRIADAEELLSLPADDAASAFDVLADHQAIDRALADQMRRAVGLRNLIAHGYPAVDHTRIQSEYREGIASLRRFLAAVSAEAGL